MPHVRSTPCPTDEVWIAYGAHPCGEQVWSYGLTEEVAEIRFREEFRRATLHGTAVFKRQDSYNSLI